MIKLLKNWVQSLIDFYQTWQDINTLPPLCDCDLCAKYQSMGFDQYPGHE